MPVPARPETIRRQIAGSKIGALLARMGGPAEAAEKRLASLIDNLLALQNLVWHFGETIASADVNPLLAQEDGCVGVDALIELR